MDIFLSAYKIRRTEQSLLSLFAAGKVSGTIHTCVGQEFVGLSISPHLHESDTVISNHRCHGHYLSRYDDVPGLIGEILGKPSGICRGFGGSQHLHRPGFFSSGIQGGMTPAAAGLAFANKLAGSRSILVDFIGDGTLGQGVVYETFNIASKHNLPILFVLENNYCAQSTSQQETLSGTIKGRAKAFDIQYYHASTFELDQLLETSRAAIDFVRSTRRPAFYQVDTYRLNAHSKGDDTRDPEEVEAVRKRDLLTRFLEDHDRRPLVQNQLKAIDETIDQIVESVQKEENSLRWMPQVSERPSKGQFSEVATSCPFEPQAKEINKALHRAFSSRNDVILLGEDICDPYGGAFRVSKGLSTQYPDRVFNMPISEPSIVGLGLGLALGGYTTLVEIMFGDFLALAFDQILNQAAKVSLMFGKSIHVPLIVRTPMGGGRGYGATHSQSLEKFVYGVPNIDTFVLHPRVDAASFYDRLINNLQIPSFVFENKLLYNHSSSSPLPPGYRQLESDEPYPMTRLVCDAGRPDISVICVGGVGLQLEKAMKRIGEEEINLDVFYPLHLTSPSLIGPIVESVSQTGKLMILEEGTEKLNLSAEFVKGIVLELPGKSVPKIRTLSAPDAPLPSAGYLEGQFLPHADRICETVLNLFDC